MKIINDEIEVVFSSCDPDCSTDNCGRDGDDTNTCGGSINH